MNKDDWIFINLDEIIESIRMVNMDQITENLYTRLKPIYNEMLKNLIFPEDLYPFCVQWGPDFPKARNEGILFVGKATNGWVSNSKDIGILFDYESYEKIFNRPDQLAWVVNNENEEYNSNYSAFWRLIKKVVGDEKDKEWWRKVAWSNLFKMNPVKGNPSSKLMHDQFHYCVDILKTEIEILSPRVVIFLTSNWEKDFIRDLGDENEFKFLGSKNWDGYKTSSYFFRERLIIRTQHPQGKNGNNHSEAIISLMKGFN